MGHRCTLARFSIFPITSTRVLAVDGCFAAISGVCRRDPHTYTRVHDIAQRRCLNRKRDTMHVTSTKSRTFSVAIAAAVTFQATTARAQHASDNPVSTADDAYGLTLGLESVGIYSPGLVRGFNPQAAGNVRIDGLYIDQQGELSNRVVEGSTIKAGVSEIGYTFPAPTGIVDYDLRHAGGNVPSATI